MFTLVGVVSLAGVFTKGSFCRIDGAVAVHVAHHVDLALEVSNVIFGGIVVTSHIRSNSLVLVVRWLQVRKSNLLHWLLQVLLGVVRAGRLRTIDERVQLLIISFLCFQILLKFGYLSFEFLIFIFKCLIF